MQAIGRRPQWASDGALLHYERSRPKQATLHRLVQRHATSFIPHTETSTGSELPRFIKDEFDALVECDLPTHGVLKLRRGECGHDKLPAFSCRRREFFSSLMRMGWPQRFGRSVAESPLARRSVKPDYISWL